MFYHSHLPHKQTLFFASIAVLLCGMVDELQAQPLTAPNNCAGLAAIRQQDLYKYDPVGIANLIRRGCPPSVNWDTPVNSELGAGGGGSPLGALARVPAHTSSLGYKAKGVCSKLDTTKAGGLSDDGAIDPCKTGGGKPWFNLNIMIPKIPQIGAPNLDCISNLYGMLTSFNPANLTPQLTGSVSGSCATGTLTPAIVGECGMDSVSRNVCVGDQNSAETEDTTENTTVAGLDKPFSRKVPPNYVVVDGVKEMAYENNSLNKMTSIQLPNGGKVIFTTEDGTVYEYVLEPNSFVTMNSAGEVFFGPNWTGTYPTYTSNNSNSNITSTNDRIILEPSTGSLDPAMSYVTIIPNQQVVNVDSVIFEGDTLNKQVNYSSYNTTNTANPDDGRTPTDPYDPRANTVDVDSQTGPGAQQCIEPNVANLAGLPAAQNYCVGAQRVGLSNQGVSNGQPTLECPPELSLFCVEKPNQQINNAAPVAAQYP
jgi:hypothetical protein